jgi:hypothetical protein
MQSLQGSAGLQVSDGGLHVQSALCESMAGKLAGNRPPVGAECTGLASALAVKASHARIAAAGMRCSLRVQSTAAKLTTVAGRFAENEARSVAQFHAVAASTVS